MDRCSVHKNHIHGENYSSALLFFSVFNLLHRGRRHSSSFPTTSDVSTQPQPVTATAIDLPFWYLFPTFSTPYQLPATPIINSFQIEHMEEDVNTLLGMGCKACGQEEIERGCNGEGRIQGGIETVPGFGWWPIKAYRPCPGFLASGGRYRRQGQSMDEVAFGRGGKPAMGSDDDTQSRYNPNGSS
ncbi:hypothetical protein RJ641_001415 [Dillenia turbinata]|uniref:Uncharacterized protein n=1 Tax=Dillenia turbinata TaxID=194707 RepID=A0AAN8ZSF6_9MAGN